MKRRTKTELIIEQEELLVVSVRPQEISAWCEACGAEVQMITPEAAAALFGTSALNIFRLVEAKQLHFTETPEGALLVCSRLLDEAEQPQRRKLE